MRRLLVTVVGVATLSALTFAARAQADEDSYIDHLRSHGQTVLPSGEGSWITGGYRICDRIREAGLDAGMRVVTPMPGRDPETVIYAVQHYLCPDTLEAQSGGSSSSAIAGASAADEEIYLQYLRDHGQTVLQGGEGRWILQGYAICDRIRTDGREAGLRIVTPMPGRDPEIVIHALQHYLCTDTLGAAS